MKKIVLLCLMGLVVSAGYCQRGMLFPKRPNGNALRGAAFTLRQGIMSINRSNPYIQPIKNNWQSTQQAGPYSHILRNDSTNMFIRSRLINSQKTKLKTLQELEDEWLKQIPDSTLYLRAGWSLSRGDTANYVKLLRMAVKKKYAPALYDYGRILVLGEYVEKDQRQGWQLIQKAAEQNYLEAMFLLGMEYYYYGIDCPLDTIKGFDWLKKAADAGYFPANLETGSIYLNKADTANAITYYTKADNIGWDHRSYVIYYGENYESLLSGAEIILGNYYYNKKDIDTAIKYWSHAAYFGDGEAAYHVGFRLLEGSEVKQDIKSGITYMEMAARLGYTEAQAYYGDCYMNGVGVERDSLKAIEWWKKAGEAGHAGAQYCLTCKYYQANDNDSTIYWGEKPECKDSSLIQYCVGMAYYCKDNTEEARNWWKKAAEQDLPDACWWLSSIEWENDSVAAFPYLQKAAELNYPEAICDMGIEYLYGGFVEKDQEKAVKLLSQAADMGCANAFNTLGIIYFWKEYKRMDRKLAVEYWKRGAELDPELWGTADCQYNYGMCLKKGHGVKKDKEAAIFWLKLAAKNGSEEAKEELQKMHIGIEEE